MTLIPCRHCGKQISDKAAFCPGCGQSASSSAARFCVDCGAKLSENTAYCTNCGCPTEVSHAVPKTPAAKTSSGRTLLVILAAVLVLVLLLRQGNSASPPIFPNAVILTGDDKVAYELLLDAAYDFKEPSSVRLVSGCVGVDKDCMFCGISATNGFGARTTSYYYVCPDFVLEEEDPSSLYTKTDELNVEKINRKLAENFEGY